MARKLARLVLVALVIVLVATLTVADAQGRADDLGALGTLYENEQYAQIALFAMLAIVVAALGPELMALVRRDDQRDVKEAVRYLEGDTLFSGRAMRQHDYAWLFYDLRGRFGGVGISTGNYPASSLGPVDWSKALARFDHAGLIKSETFHPDMGHAYQVWQLTALGSRTIRYLDKHRPADPVTLADAGRSQIRLYRLRRFLYPVTPRRWRLSPRSVRRKSGDQP